MKVLLASTGADVASGATRCLIELAEQLMIRHVEVVVVIPRHGDIEQLLSEKHIKYVYIHEYHSWYTSDKHVKNHFIIKRILNIKTVIQMIRLIKREHIELVHVNALTAYVAGWAGNICKIPVIWHAREFMEEDLNITFFDKKYSIKKINKATLMIAISNAVRDKWKNFFKIPIKVIHDGLPIQNYYIEKKVIEKEIVRIIIYGRIVSGKGQLFFFEGINEIIKNLNRKIEIIWAGQIEDRSYFEQVQNYIREQKLSKYVTYLGEISDIKSVLKNVDIVCVCSKQEGFGRVTVEAMLSQCIVLGADTGATREIVIDENKGYLYKSGDITDFANKLLFIINNIEDSRKVSFIAQKYAVEEFSIDNNANKILEVYKEVLY